MAEIHTTDSLKSVRETLCVVQSVLHLLDGWKAANIPEIHYEILERLLEDIDRQRPLGNNGNHGELHTATCGCEEKE